MFISMSRKRERRFLAFGIGLFKAKVFALINRLGCVDRAKTEWIVITKSRPGKNKILTRKRRALENEIVQLAT